MTLIELLIAMSLAIKEKSLADRPLVDQEFGRPRYTQIGQFTQKIIFFACNVAIVEIWAGQTKLYDVLFRGNEGHIRYLSPTLSGELVEVLVRAVGEAQHTEILAIAS